MRDARGIPTLAVLLAAHSARAFPNLTAGAPSGTCYALLREGASTLGRAGFVLER